MKESKQLHPQDTQRGVHIAKLEQQIAALRRACREQAPQSARTRRFRALVWEYYIQQGRSHPWRETSEWYPVLVSEAMLQQTQVERVLPKYQAFLQSYPTPNALATAPLSAVLRSWQGLGYNRRAKALQACCAAVLSEHAGVLPKTYEELISLPGVGDYTANALRAFVHQQSAPVIETNIKTVYLHCFLWNKKQIETAEIIALADRYSDARNPKEWNYALMDLGAYLKSQGYRYNSRFVGYRPQSKFEGSIRQIRGHVIRRLSQEGRQTAKRLAQGIEVESETLHRVLESLCRESLIVKEGRSYALPN